MEKLKEIVTDTLILVLVFACIILFVFWFSKVVVHWDDGPTTIQAEAIELGYARYNPVNGEWEWNNRRTGGEGVR